MTEAHDPMFCGLFPSGSFYCISSSTVYWHSLSSSVPYPSPPGGSAPAAAAAAAHANPFQVSQPAPPTLNQMRVSPMPSGFAAMPDSMAQPITMVPVAGMAPIGRAMPGMGVSGVGMPGSMSMPQPLMSMPPQGQPTGTTNPFLLWGGWLGGRFAPELPLSLLPLSFPLLAP